MPYPKSRDQLSGATCYGAKRARPGLVARLVACLALAGATVGASAALIPAPVRAAAPAAAASVAFPGPSRGTPGTQAPGASAFVTHCNAGVNTDPGKTNGADLAPGSAVEAEGGCGMAVLPLDVSGQGQLRASFGVSDNDTTGQPAVVRIRVLDPYGFNLYTGDVTAQHGSPATINVDVTHAVAVQMDFLKSPKTFVYGVHLTGGARSLTPVQTSGAGLPAGARPVDMSAVAASCNANKVSSTTPLTVTRVGIPAASSVSGTGCGTFMLAFPANTRGTLALRYGADDTSTGGNEVLFARAFDATGRLLRKATGVASVGAGLQPLWLDLSGVRTVQLAIDGGTDVKVDITAVGVLPGRMAPYVTTNLVQSGGSTRRSVAIDPHAFASRCNSGIGSSDVAVARRPVPGGAYLSTYSCGSASLFFCCTNAQGVFHTRFGVPDTETAGKPATVTVIVEDKNNHVLSRRSYSALGGNPGVSIDIPLRLGASVVSFAFGGASGLLYDLRLTGIATISERIYAPSEPPVEVPRGVAVNPHDFSVHCNSNVATEDQRVVGATTLEGWALVGEACGEADLALAGTKYPRRDFYARVGIALGEPPNTVATFHFNVLNGAGKVIHSTKIQARYGYGTQPVHVSLRGGATVQIIWDSQTLSGTVVYAMTAA